MVENWSGPKREKGLIRDAVRTCFCTKLKTRPLFLIFLLILATVLPAAPSHSQEAGTVSYEFLVYENGSTLVKIRYHVAADDGSTWILVPKFAMWINKTLKGEVTDWSIIDAYEFMGFSNPFYEAFSFSYVSDVGEFEIYIEYNHTLAAMIIEPKGIFFSPQIGFEKGNKAEISVVLPAEFNLKRDEAVAFGSTSNYRPSSIDLERNMVFFKIPETENLLRVEIGFETQNRSAELVELHSGIFTFETTARYEEYARRILEFYNETYDALVDLFNMTLEDARIVFFLPEFELLLSIGGYVPFTSEKLGDIHINILYIRAVEGQIEVIALHELVHHFLWKAGISPEGLLWFHEGMAQYVSIEISNRLNYEGAIMMKQQIQSRIPDIRTRFRDNFGFLQKWNPRYTPQDVGSYYVAAYYIVREIASRQGRLDYYRRFFRSIRDESIEDNAELAYYLSLVAGESVASVLNRWGFDVPDLYIYYPLLKEVKLLIENLSRLFEPYRSLTETLYKAALLNADQENEVKMTLYLMLAVLIAKTAPLLTMMTAVTLAFCLLLLLLRSKRVI
jgi:hypothetical protein